MIQVVDKLGPMTTTSKSILNALEVEGMTHEDVEIYLQKYRRALLRADAYRHSASTARLGDLRGATTVGDAPSRSAPAAAAPSGLMLSQSSMGRHQTISCTPRESTRRGSVAAAW